MSPLVQLLLWVMMVAAGAVWVLWPPSYGVRISSSLEARVAPVPTLKRTRPHIDALDRFQSDKYPTCPPGKVPLSVEDPTAQSLLWEYAQRRRELDAAFADDLEYALRGAGFEPSDAELARSYHAVHGEHAMIEGCPCCFA